jgi:hypothetical protein
MRRSLYIAVAGVALVSALAACGNSSPAAPTAGAGKSAVTSSPSAQPGTGGGTDGAGNTGTGNNTGTGTGTNGTGTNGTGTNGTNGNGGTGGGAPAGDQKPGRCHTAGLRGELHLFSRPGQAGSEQDAELGLTNMSGQPCVVYGYPGLQLFGADGRSHPTTVDRTTTKPPTAVTLAPGATAWSLIAWSFMPSGDEADSSPLCGGKMTQLKVIPPDETTQLTVSAGIGTVCDHGKLWTGPMRSDRPSRSAP